MSEGERENKYKSHHHHHHHPPQILSSYTSHDIQSAVGHRLYHNLSPWQLLCARVDRDSAWPLWQERLRVLEDLLKECQEEFFTQTEPRKMYEGVGGGGKGGKGVSYPPGTCNQVQVSDRELSAGDSNSYTPVKKEESNNFEVSSLILPLNILNYTVVNAIYINILNDTANITLSCFLYRCQITLLVSLV